MYRANPRRILSRRSPRIDHCFTGKRQDAESSDGLARNNGMLHVLDRESHNVALRAAGDYPRKTYAEVPVSGGMHRALEGSSGTPGLQSKDQYVVRYRPSTGAPRSRNATPPHIYPGRPHYYGIIRTPHGLEGSRQGMDLRHRCGERSVRCAEQWKVRSTDSTRGHQRDQL